MNYKKILISFFSLFVFLGIGLVVFINPVLEKAKPKLLDAASAALKNQVTADKIGVSLFPTTGFILSGVQIGNSPKDIKIGNVEIDISLPDVLKGLVTLRKAKIEEVFLHGELLENGKFELDGLPKKSETEIVPDAKDSAAETSKINSRKNDAGLSISIEDLLIKNLQFEVHNQKTKKAFVAKVSKASLTKDGAKGKVSFDAELGAGSLGFNGHLPSYKIDPKDLRVDGVLTASFANLNEIFDFLEVDRNKIEIAAINLQAKVSKPTNDILAVEIDKLTGDYFEQSFIVTGAFKNAITGDGVIKLKVPNLNLQKLVKLNDNIKNYRGELKNIECDVEIFQKNDFSPKCTIAESIINEVKIALNELRASYTLSEKAYKIQNLDLKLAEGIVNVVGNGVLARKSQLELTATSLDIAQLLKLSSGKDEKAAVNGTIASVKSSISLDGSNKHGDFSVSIAPFSVRGLNIFKKVADALETVPGISTSLATQIPEEYAGVLTSDNSEFKDIEITGGLQNSKISLSKVRANSKGYYLLGSGEIDEGEVDLDLSFIVDALLVAEIEKKNPKIASIKNPDGQIVVPVTIKKSKDGLPILLPDLKNLLKQQIGIKIKDNAKKSLDKLSPGLGGLVDGFLN